jgi:hypothetical protein
VFSLLTTSLSINRNTHLSLSCACCKLLDFSYLALLETDRGHQMTLCQHLKQAGRTYIASFLSPPTTLFSFDACFVIAVVVAGAMRLEFCSG